MRIALVVPSPIKPSQKYFRIIEVDPASIPFFNRAVLSLGDMMVILTIDKTHATIDQDITDGEEPILAFTAAVESQPASEEERYALNTLFLDDEDWGAQAF